MGSSIFYNHTKLKIKGIVDQLENYSSNKGIQMYLVSSPLGQEYSYSNVEYAFAILSPGYKLFFINICDHPDFENYYEDFIADIGYISSKYKYQEFIGRPREWKSAFTTKHVIHTGENFDIDNLFETNKLPEDQKRKGELLISLITGCINDINKVGVLEPISLLEQVKKKIILFDAEQTRFIYRDFPIKKIISVQGLSGTGKTELLLHKLKDLYIQDDNSRIFFTCHNIALAKKLRQRIPDFFDFMKVEKQIKWGERIWMTHAWGSRNDPHSGFYSYICKFYNLRFYQYSTSTNYNFIFNAALNEIKKIPSKHFQPCFDYILIDESQDFPDVFFDLCKKIVRHKIYAAGDVFQDIFETVKKKQRGVDIVLNRCYRTDPRTLMFAHSVGLGLFEEHKLNWFDNDGWERIGYKVKEIPNQNLIQLSRSPINRFGGQEIDHSVIIINNTMGKAVCDIILNLRNQNPDIVPGDIAIILLDDDQSIYAYIDKLSIMIKNKVGWDVARGYEIKEASPNSIYITNPNNVKGLEFPYVICITHKILNTYRYRNTLYTMLTRSFIQSYLLVSSADKVQLFNDSLEKINTNNYIEATIPSDQEQVVIKQNIIKYQEESNISYKDFIEDIFKEVDISDEITKQKIIKALEGTNIDKFDREQTMQYILLNKKFFQ